MKEKPLQCGLCLSCAGLAWSYGRDLGSTEFGGGRITGPLLNIFGIGLVLFLVALVLTLMSLRIGAGVALAASLLCFPLYVYFTAPGPFRAVFPGDYSVPLRGNYVWDRWSVAGIVVLAATAFFCVRSLVMPATDGRGRPSLH